jgi:hypothetical protein
MKPSDHLFFLIHSLSKTEKAYFTKFAGRHGAKTNSTYLKLFRAIEKQQAYDEKKLLTDLKGQQLTEQISVYKNYLYRLILRALHNYYSGNTSTSKISELLHYSEILKERGLFNQSRKVLEQANEIAEKYEHKELMLDIIRRKVDILINTQDFDEHSEETINKHHLETLQLLKKIELVSERNKQAAIVRIGMRTKGLFNISTRSGIIRPLVEGDEAASFDSMKLYYWMCGIYYKAQYEMKEALVYFNKIMALFDVNEHQVYENLQLYIACQYHILGILNETRDKAFDAAIARLEKLEKELSKDTRYVASCLRIRMICIEALSFWLFKECRFDGIHKLVNELEKTKLLERVEEYTIVHGQEFLEGRKEAIIFYLGVFLLEGGYYKESIRWLNKLATSKGDVHKSGPRLVSKLIVLIGYSETKDYALLKSAAKHYQRIISEDAPRYKFEMLFVDTLLKISKEESRVKENELFKQLKQVVLHYGKSKSHNQSFHYFDFPEWVESKLQAKPMREILIAKTDQ